MRRRKQAEVLLALEYEAESAAQAENNPAPELQASLSEVFGQFGVGAAYDSDWSDLDQEDFENMTVCFQRGHVGAPHVLRSRAGCVQSE